VTTRAPRVLVTRAAEDAEALSHLLAVRGYQPVRVPLLSRQWRIDEVVRAAISHPDVDIIVVTSGVAADVIAAAAPGAWLEARFAAVGPATAQRLRQHGLPVHVTPSRATGSSLVQALGDLRGRSVLYPRSAAAPPLVAEALRAAGATVFDIIAYTNEAPPDHEQAVRAAVPVDATTVLSGSAGLRLADALRSEHYADLGRVVCIGPSTAAVCRTAGLPVHTVASQHTLGGLLSALSRMVPPAT
jgi:uroporphyrinogen-III synthase